MAQAYRTRLDVLFARAASRAVILRRGPKRHFHLIAWNLETDHFEHGQWMKGHVRLCDLSPDGQWLLYWAHQYHASARWRRRVEEVEERGYDPLNQPPPRRSLRRRELRRGAPRYLREEGPLAARPRANQGVWTALSRPPYFTALALWPSFGHWTGGGYFPSRRSVALQEGEDGLAPKLFAPPPSDFRILKAGAEGLEPPLSAALQEDWGAEQSALAGPPLHAHEARRAALRPIVQGLRDGGARWVEFVSPRLGGDLLFGCDGAIFRLPAWRDVPPEQRLAAARQLIDLTQLSFKRVPPPPDAMRW